MEEEKGSYTEECTLLPEQGKHRQCTRLLRGREKSAAPRLCPACPPAGAGTAGTGRCVCGTLFPHGPRPVWRRSLSLCIRQSRDLKSLCYTLCLHPAPSPCHPLCLGAAAMAGVDGAPLLGGVRGCLAADTRGSAGELCGFPAGETSNLTAVSKPWQQTAERCRA